MHRALTSSRVHGRFSVAKMVALERSSGGETNKSITTDEFANHIKASCAAKGVSEPIISEMVLPALPRAQRCVDRAEEMHVNGESLSSSQPRCASIYFINSTDHVLGNILDDELEKGDYTIVYFAGAAAAHDKYQADFDHPAQAPIKKRAVSGRAPLVERPQTRKDKTDPRPLFEKYQFFTPGVFMSLAVFFLLLTILYVGLSAAASLQVSYGAFDKEMGPFAQKKQQ